MRRGFDTSLKRAEARITRPRSAVRLAGCAGATTCAKVPSATSSAS